ncbi:hypothetical protein SAJA_09575 [Salinisphaera japonica YTM-1]|uniref:Uncharacterized protein n=2 Tax=Salinisphaera TaxID=180541 RepID=A0A423PPE6_9GAMM|nr:hypothetical protein SAJA_09575 [Salinisphaera japonica YTM-1]
MRDVQFRPDYEESEQLRHSYYEWQAYETIRAQREEEYKFLKARGKKLDALESVERKIQKRSLRNGLLFLKVGFHIVVFLAAIVILYKAL